MPDFRDNLYTDLPTQRITHRMQKRVLHKSVSTNKLIRYTYLVFFRWQATKIRAKVPRYLPHSTYTPFDRLARIHAQRSAQFFLYSTWLYYEDHVHYRDLVYYTTNRSYWTWHGWVETGNLLNSIATSTHMVVPCKKNINLLQALSYIKCLVLRTKLGTKWIACKGPVTKQTMRFLNLNSLLEIIPDNSWFQIRFHNW